MNPKILNTEIQSFITSHLKSDVSSLLLKGVDFQDVDIKEIVEQIEAKNRCTFKLSTWFKCENIYFPNKLNIEQTSSEITAQYKAQLISGDSIIDLTGGFGVDCYYFSKQFKCVTHCEINSSLSAIVNHNFKQLKAENISTITGDGIAYLKTSKSRFDWIYIDPSRRHDSKGKVFFLNDCLPNVPENLDLLFSHSNNILIKTSPLLDLTIGINELKLVKTIHIVAFNNEVKELLWVLDRDFTDEISIKTVNLKKDSNEVFNFVLSDEKRANSNYSKPQSFLYEPNVSVLKAGAFESVSEQLDIYKLHKHSHLYTNDRLIEFPGRRFKIEQVFPFNKKEIKKLGVSKANITTRNFPETVQNIRKKFKIKDGGNRYLFFTTNFNDEKIVIITSKV
ncbi:class I SAM-dependent methyltransferase [Tamlana sp. 2_MG-2023]|uniref:THUMP-like domain-containing protein n=1 Tax=unclassified Tamlana TaxID=2614803 RepID=UPI0026E25755|nr:MULTISPECIES: class I SAM-dependent methyltransferase [unclassified Tamlana]MDO6759289.1 class I SAM-dependent methyltransferase [Tamlana sp. 2_MG-2023]MDO6790572.1 class I SAM-dependent methyltransferase [Tamlana sp. 1_MG-2023]